MGQRLTALMAGLLMGVALLFSAIPLTHAQSDGAEATLRERREKSATLTLQAATAFEDGDFQVAKDLLLRARRLFADPIIDYNLARVHEELGETSLAIGAYRRYITVSPNAPNVSAVEAKIAELSERKTGESSGSSPPVEEGHVDTWTQQRKSELEVTDESLSPWPVVLLGVGAAGVAVGAGLAVNAASAAENLNQKAENQVVAGQMLDDARAQETIGNVAIVAGSAILTGGLVWLLAETLSASSKDLQAEAHGQSLMIRF